MDEPEGSHLGGAVAAPVFKEIAEQALALPLHVPPVGSTGRVASDPQAVGVAVFRRRRPAAHPTCRSRATTKRRPTIPRVNGTKWRARRALPRTGATASKVNLPNLAGMTIAEAIRAAHRNGIELAFDEGRGAASGVAIQQRPSAGLVPAQHPLPRRLRTARMSGAGPFRLRALLEGVPDVDLRPCPPKRSTSRSPEVRDDSRLVQPGDLFVVAVPGTKIDARQFVPDVYAARGLLFW